MWIHQYSQTIAIALERIVIKKNWATYITSAPNLRSHFLILLHFILPFFLFFFFFKGGVCATAYLAVLPTIVRYYARNRFVHTWLVSNHHVIKIAQLKTRGRQKQTPPFSMKICRYSSANIICSEMRTGFRDQSLRETVTFGEMVTSKDKYTSIF